MERVINPDIEEITTPTKLTNLISLVASLTVLGFTVVCYLLLEVKSYILIVFVLFSTLNFGIYLFFRSTQNVKLVYKLTSSLIFAGVLLISVLNGGIKSSFVFFIPVVVISGYAMKVKYGNVWLLLAFISFIALYFLDDNFINQINGVSVESNDTFSLFTLMLATGVLGGVYGRYLSFSMYKSIKKTLEIGEKSKEKEILLKEVQQRVQSNLKTIIELLTLQSSYIEDNKTKAHFEFSKYRINAMALIHAMLYKSENVSKINFKDYVHDLSHYLLQTLKGTQSDIDIHIIAENIYFNMDTAIPLGLVANEILTNSFIYSLKEGKGLVTIKLEQLNHPDYLLEIGDNGLGFSDEVRFDTVGLDLIESFALKVKGSVEKDTDKSGSKFVIIFQETLSVT